MPTENSQLPRIYADGIQKSHAQALRLEVGRCVVDKVQKKMWPTYDEWVAARDSKSGLTSDQGRFFDEIGIPSNATASAMRFMTSFLVRLPGVPSPALQSGRRDFSVNRTLELDRHE